MRFIQYKRKDEPATRLGIISEDGGKMVDLSAICPHLKDMIGFIKAGPNGMQKIQEKSSEFKWDSVTARLESRENRVHWTQLSGTLFGTE